jgi:hypothetical protein
VTAAQQTLSAFHHPHHRQRIRNAGSISARQATPEAIPSA